MDFRDELVGKFGKAGISLSEMQATQFEQYYELLIEWNEKMNLTAIKDQSGVIEKHFLDSVLPLQKITLSDNTVFVDVGTGAGFPAVPWLILKPDFSGLLLDSLKKRTVFLETLVEKLQLSDRAEILHGRAEELGKNPLYREQFDVATARAVTKLYALGEYTLPFVKVDGYCLAMKGPDISEEVEDGKRQVKKLGGKIRAVEHYDLPNGDGRSLVIIEKVKETPEKYPRTHGQIKKEMEKNL